MNESLFGITIAFPDRDRRKLCKAKKKKTKRRIPSTAPLLAMAIQTTIGLLLLISSIPFGSAEDSGPAFAEREARTLDCGMRAFALEFAKELLEPKDGGDYFRNEADAGRVLRDVSDALEMPRLCPEERVDGRPPQPSNLRRARVSDSASASDADNETDQTEDTDLEESLLRLSCHRSATCIFVAPTPGHPYQNEARENRKKIENGSLDRPWTSLHRALHHSRSLSIGEKNIRNAENITIVLRGGIHSLEGEPLVLSEPDSGLTIKRFPGEDSWISGGVSLSNAVFRPVQAIKEDEQRTVYVADLTELLKGWKIPKSPSLMSRTRRYIRARHPNGDPEVVDPNFFRSDTVLEWTKPEKAAPPEFELYDFAKDPPEGVPYKNDSAMDGYNQYASGSGGACAEIWGESADSYWCSNASQGGWAEVDRECATSGEMQIPVGMTYNRSDPSLGPLYSNASVSSYFSSNQFSMEGGVVFAYHSQSWSVHMFEIASHSASNGTMAFAKGGGKQGGRNWCRCDQCTYAGGWCGQHETPPNPDDTRLIGGNWRIENTRALLDQPGEYYFDRDSRKLYVIPNATNHQDLRDLSLGLLTDLIKVQNRTAHVTIEGISFRDQAATFLEEGWSAPSGGDWALRRGGAILIENASNVEIRRCFFFRLDGNAIFLSGKTHFVKIRRNRFEWLGESAIATWGDTDGYDATGGNLPMHTLVEGNVMRELGIYQKQSSAVGQCKASLTTIRNNIMFNMGRAAINFNDMLGGGDLVENNLIFNTCRESGDHGPINSWDRQAYLTDLKGNTKGFVPLLRTIRNNFIFANYGASQGVDNDDGSSWYHIHHNVFYQADGFKMDYGGHDSIYEYNMAMSLSYNGGPCFGMGSFLEGHGDVLRGNRCLLGVGNTKHNAENKAVGIIYNKWRSEALQEHYGYPAKRKGSGTGEGEPNFVGRLWGGCEDSHVTLESNEYYTPDGVAVLGCGNDFYNLSEVEARFGLEGNSTVSLLPETGVILEWARSTLGFAPNTNTAHHETISSHASPTNLS